MNKAKIMLIIAVIAVFTVPIIIGFALQSWTHTIGYTGEGITEDFTVYTDDTYTTVAPSGSSEDLGSYVVGNQLQQTFYIKNTGNVAITIEVASETNSNAANTVTWTLPTLSLGVDETGVMTLTIDVNEPGAATYQFEFGIQ